MPEINIERRIKRHIWAAEHRFFAVTKPGVESICAAELSQLRMAELNIQEGGVEFSGSIEDMYAANLHLRSAGRILMRLKDFRVRSWTDLLRQADNIPWELILPGRGCNLDVRVSLHQSNLKHTGRISEEIFWAAAKHMEQAGLTLPEKANADEDALSIQVRAVDRRCAISLDTSGDNLHRRGYRLAGGKAPLREDLAAAMLIFCGYDGVEPLLDPMCGSGTLPIEAAMLARSMAPGLNRRFAFEDLACHREAAWNYILGQAREYVADKAPGRIMGAERAKGGLEMAKANAQRAYVAGDIDLEQIDFLDSDAPEGPGLLVINPPYGKRLGSVGQAEDTIAKIGQRLRDGYKGWRCGAVLYKPHWAEMLGLEDVRSFNAPHGGLNVTIICGSVPA